MPEIAEPPKPTGAITDTPPLQPAVEALKATAEALIDGKPEPKVEEKPKPKKRATADQLEDLLKGKEAEDFKPIEEKPKEEKKVEAKVEKPVEEKPKEEKKEAPKGDDDFKEKLPKGAVRDHFAAVEKKAIEAEKERDSLKTKLAEMEKAQAELAKVGEESPALQKKLEEAQQRIDALTSEMRLVAIDRDPEFVRKFVTGKENLLGELKDLAVAAGATEEQFKRAIKLGQEEQIEEWREALQPAQQRRFSAIQLKIEQLDVDREAARKDAESTYSELMKKRQEQNQHLQQEQINGFKKVAAEVEAELFNVDGFKEDEELRAVVRASLTGLAGGEGRENWGHKAIMASVAAGHMFHKVSLVQAKVIEGLKKSGEEQTAKIAELEKRIAEQDEFIKGQAGGVPRGEVRQDGKTPGGKYVPSWEQMSNLPK